MTPTACQGLDCDAPAQPDSTGHAFCHFHDGKLSPEAKAERLKRLEDLEAPGSDDQEDEEELDLGDEEDAAPETDEPGPPLEDPPTKQMERLAWLASRTSPVSPATAADAWGITKHSARIWLNGEMAKGTVSRIATGRYQATGTPPKSATPRNGLVELRPAAPPDELTPAQLVELSLEKLSRLHLNTGVELKRRAEVIAAALRGQTPATPKS